MIKKFGIPAVLNAAAMYEERGIPDRCAGANDASVEFRNLL